MTPSVELPTPRVDPRSLLYVPCVSCRAPLNLGDAAEGAPTLCLTCRLAQPARARREAA